MAVSINGDGTITGLSTLDSTTITGLTSLTTTDLTADTTTLVVDSANNRVGIGTASPTVTCDVNGTINATTLQQGGVGVLLTSAIGSTVQAYDADLTTLSGLSSADGNFIVGSATGWVVESGSTARTSLGLGTAATTASTDYATAAQGSLADSAVQPGDNISTLTNDAGYVTGNQTITLSGDLSGSGTTSINAQIAANVVGANELNVSGDGTTSQFLRSDGDGSFTWATVSVTAAAVSDQANTSTGYFDLPAGTTAQRPGSPATGMIRFNTDTNVVESYDGTSWRNVYTPSPEITSISPTDYDGEAGTTITVNGNYFTVDAKVWIRLNGGSYTQMTTTFVNSQQLTFDTASDYTTSQSPIDIKVIQESGEDELLDALTTGSSPTWVTASGSLGTYNEGASVSTAVSVSDDGTVTYAVTSGALPSGVTLNASTGAITGTAPAVASNTTYNFEITATDNAGNTSGARAFSITVNNINYEVEYLIIAGGGGGGGTRSSGGSAGGGGAGGYRTGTAYPTIGQSYTITVGAGGGGGSSANGGGNGTNGANSVGINITSIGGGTGGGGDNGPTAGTSGGSGGGGGYRGYGAAGTSGQGNAGGNQPNGGSPYGGAGSTSSITGTSVARAGGGGGGSENSSGGTATAGGGNGRQNGSGYNATANTGGGGGGAGNSTDGKNGGSGVVIIKEPAAPTTASGMWSLDAVYENVKAGTWV